MFPPLNAETFVLLIRSLSIHVLGNGYQPICPDHAAFYRRSA